MVELLRRYRRILRYVVPRAAVWAVVLLADILLLRGAEDGAETFAVVLAIAALGWIWWRRFSADGDTHQPARLSLAFCLGVGTGDWEAAVVFATAALLTAAYVEPTVLRLSEPRLTAHRLPGYSRHWIDKIADPLFHANCAATIVLALTTADVLPSTPMAIIVAAVLAVGVGVAGLQLVRLRRRQPQRAVIAALKSYAPRFFVYFSGTGLATYQLRMWLPYLQRTGLPGVILLRNPDAAPAALAASDWPLIVARSVQELEHLMIPGVGAMFYVNNDLRNAEGVRFPALNHVHLGHGDSDKPASYAATTVMFDRIFVAGQAGADRFADHQVPVPPEKFVLVGRPQVEDIEVRPAGASMPAQPTVLYAPTWRGGLEDMRFGSMPDGIRIVKALVAAGARVIFRPHPFAERDAQTRVLISRIDAQLEGTGHLRSTEASKLSIFDCFNRTDALVTDISSVASDFLYSNKPFALTDAGTDGALASFPLARAAVAIHLADELSDAVSRLLGEDVLAPARAEVREYYLGPWAPQEYSSVFVREAVAAIEAPIRSQPAASVRPNTPAEPAVAPDPPR